MSPEQIRGERYGKSSDIFATGIVFYELITYVHPFRDKKMARTIENILHQDTFQFEAQCPDAPPGLWPIIRTCLAKDPEERCATMADLARACRELLARLGGQAPAAVEGGPAPESVSSLLVESQEALGRMDFDAALSAAQQARRLDPSSPQITPLLGRIVEAKEQTRRKEEVAKLLVKVEECILRRDLALAEDYAQQALAVLPSHPRALECLDRLAQAKKDEARDRQVSQLAAEAMQALDRGDLETAESCARRMQDLDAQSSAARNLLLLAGQAREKSRTDRVRTLLRQAHEAQEAWEFLKAAESAREVLRLDGTNREALRLLADLGEAPPEHREDHPAAVPGSARGKPPAPEPRVSSGEAATGTAGGGALEDATAPLKESEKETVFLADAKGKEGPEPAAAGETAPGRAGDAAGGLEETMLLKRPKTRKTARTAALAALAVLLPAVIAGGWYFLRHRSRDSDQTAGTAQQEAGLRPAGQETAPSTPAEGQTRQADAQVQGPAATFDALIAEAQSLVSQGRLEDSVKVIQKILDVDPAFPPAVAMRSELESRISAGKSRLEQDKEIQKWAANAETLLAAGKPEQAAAEIARIERLRPDAPEAAALRARLERAGGRGRPAVAPKADKPGELGVQSASLFRQGKYAEAQEAVRRWLAESPQDAQAQSLRDKATEALRTLRLHEIATGERQYDAALQAIANLQRINPDDPNLPAMRRSAESAKAATRASFSIFRLGDAGTLKLDNQTIGSGGEVERVVVTAGRHQLVVLGKSGRPASLTAEFIDGQNREFVYDSQAAELRDITPADRDAIARRRQREEIHRFPVEHLHTFRGKCAGELSFNGYKVEYRPAEGNHGFSRGFDRLQLEIRDDRLEFVELPGGWQIQLRARDAPAAAEIKRIWDELERLAK
jgi:hypothetical protein